MCDYTSISLKKNLMDKISEERKRIGFSSNAEYIRHLFVSDVGRRRL